jgi:hypothetical protein
VITREQRYRLQLVAVIVVPVLVFADVTARVFGFLDLANVIGYLLIAISSLLIVAVFVTRPR